MSEVVRTLAGTALLSDGDAHITSGNDTATSGENAAASVQADVIYGYAWSYNVMDLPQFGTITITDGEQTVYTHDVTCGGAGEIRFTRPKKSAMDGDKLTLSISAAGAGVIGKINLI